jgi:dihydroflavonol-4-reductase
MAAEPQTRSSVLVTGASGFVGSAVAKALRRERYRVRVLVRRQSPRANIDPADEVAVGDILDRASVAAAVAGMRNVVHVAADYRLWVPDAAELMRTNVEGTRIVMEEALRAGAERIVYTSSVATFDLRDGPADETRPLPVEQAIGAYKRSKIVAENLVADMVARQRLPAVIVNPSTPIGPRDLRPTPTGRIVIEAAAGRMPAFIDTGLNVVHVDDVATGHVLACAKVGSASAISSAARISRCGGCSLTSPKSSAGGRPACNCRALRSIHSRSPLNWWRGLPDASRSLRSMGCDCRAT